MILLKGDIAKERHIVDLSTKNLSFVRMAALLGRMGIKNNKFMLTLTQPELKGVDPYAEDLSVEQITMITYECKINPWYFFREVLRIPSSGGDPIRYRLDRANLALMWCFFSCIATFLTMPRQIGKTIGTIGIVSYVMYISGRKLSIGLFAKDNVLRTENVQRLKEMRDTLPWYLVYRGEGDTNNMEDVRHGALKTSYQTFVAQNDKKKAEGQGRGFTFAFEQWDEIAYYVNNDKSYDSAIAATNTAGPQAREAGVRCANIITTTAGWLSNPAGAYAYNIKSDAMRFTEHLYDVESQEELNNILDVNSGNGMLYLEYNHLQLGKDQAWYDFVTRGKKPEVVACDYNNEWIFGGGKSLFPVSILNKLRDGKREPTTCTFVESLALHWYVEPSVMSRDEFRNRPFVLASDTSDNVGKDYTTLVMIDPSDMSVLMTCKCNQSNLVYVAQCIIKLLKDYPRSVFIPERNKNGAIMIDMLLASMENERSFNPWERIYNRYNQEFSEASPQVNTLDLGMGSIRKMFGFNTTAAANSRTALYSSVITTAVNRNHSRIYDSNIVEEICGLTTRNGRIDHGEGKHDDTLIAYLIACWFVMYGRNHHMYGIASDEILSDFNPEDRNHGDSTHQREIRRRILDIEDQLDQPINPMLVMTLRRELDTLRAMQTDTDSMSDMVSLHQVQKETTKKQRRFNADAMINTFKQLCA